MRPHLSDRNWNCLRCEVIWTETYLRGWNEGYKAAAPVTQSAAQPLDPLVKELRRLAQSWRESATALSIISNPVMLALEEVANAIVRAYPASKPTSDQ